MLAQSAVESETDLGLIKFPISQTLLEDVPPCTPRNFIDALSVYLRLRLVNTTVHRVYRWYIVMLRYIAIEVNSREIQPLVGNTEGERNISESTIGPE